MLRRTSSIKLLDVLGIRVGVSPSWFVVLFLMIFGLSRQFKGSLSTSSGTAAFFVAVVAALLFFASIVAHELGHALAARREGIDTQTIDLWFFGGLARLSRDTRTAGEEFRISVAGPVVTLLVVVACAGIGVALVGWDHLGDAALLRGGTHVTPALQLLSWLGDVNLGVLVFNLVPAYPLDGGRIARALVWGVTRDRGRGTRAAAALGRAFGWLLAGLGLYLLVARHNYYGLWAVALGVMLSGAARSATLQSAFSERLEGVRVADVMDAQPVAVAADWPLARARDEAFDRYRWAWFPVVDGAGHVVGLVREERVREGAIGDVASVMEEAGPWQIAEDESLDGLVASEPLRRLGALLAVDREGRLRGIITAGQVRRAIAGAFSGPTI